MGRTKERVAMIDHLSKGRFEFGTGRGSSTTEQRGFGIHDPDTTKDMLDEVVGQFKHMWREAEYEFDFELLATSDAVVLVLALSVAVLSSV